MKKAGKKEAKVTIDFTQKQRKGKKNIMTGYDNTDTFSALSSSVDKNESSYNEEHQEIDIDKIFKGSD